MAPRRAGAGRWGWGPSRSAPALLVGVLLVVLLTAVPAIGGVLHALAVLLGLGALMLVIWRSRRDPSLGMPRSVEAPVP